MYLYAQLIASMFRFNYAAGLLIVKDETFNLDDLREYLLHHAKQLCSQYFIGTFFRPGVIVEDSTTIINGTSYHKREINLTGQYVNTYDWDAIFFHASKTDLIHQFYDHSRNRKSSAPAVAI
jgi:hypothetical protein